VVVTLIASSAVRTRRMPWSAPYITATGPGGDQW
jgi:hypothetical protein